MIVTTTLITIVVIILITIIIAIVFVIIYHRHYPPLALLLSALLSLGITFISTILTAIIISYDSSCDACMVCAVWVYIPIYGSQFAR